MQIELNYKVFGEGFPVIILHGLFGTLDNWQTISRQLGEYYKVYVPDQRNHGKSPHTEAFSYPILADDVAHFMDSHQIIKAIIIGHSMGGKAAMQFAWTYPGRVEKLVVLDIAPKAYHGGQERIINTLLGIDLEKVGDRKEVESQMMETIPEFGVRQFLLKNLTRNENNGKLEWKMNLSVLSREIHKIMSEIDSGVFSGPTLFVRGDQSDYIIDSDIPVMREGFPKMRLETVQNAGHWLHAEQPRVLMELLLEFLQK